MSWACQGPDHVGDRIISNPFDRFSKRVTYMRADGGRRMHEDTIPRGHRCKTCADREHEELRGLTNRDQESFEM